MRIDVGRWQRRRELPVRLLSEGERVHRLRWRRGQHLRGMHRCRVLLTLAQLAVDDADSHHGTVTSDHLEERRDTKHWEDHRRFSHNTQYSTVRIHSRIAVQSTRVTITNQ